MEEGGLGGQGWGGQIKSEKEQVWLQQQQWPPNPRPPNPILQHGSIWTCTSNVASAGLSRSTMESYPPPWDIAVAILALLH